MNGMFALAIFESRINKIIVARDTCLASSVGENNYIVNSSCGFTANNRDWILFLSRLLENKSLRFSLGLGGRRRAEEKYSLNSVSKLKLSIVLD